MDYRGYSKENVHTGSVVITDDLTVQGSCSMDEKIETKTLVVSGNAEISGDLEVKGDIIVRDQVEFEDAVIELNSVQGLLNNTYTWGHIAPYNDGAVKWSGFLKEPTSSTFYLLDNETTKPLSTTSTFTNLGTLSLSKLLIPNGSATTPSIAFTGSTNTGIYAPANNNIDITASGSRCLSINSTQISTLKNIVPIGATIDLGSTGTRFDNLYANDIKLTECIAIGNGLVDTPSYTFESDSKSGLYLPATSELALTTAGIQRLSINATRLLSSVSILPSGVINLGGVSNTWTNTYSDIVRTTEIDLHTLDTTGSITFDGVSSESLIMDDKNGVQYMTMGNDKIYSKKNILNTDGTGALPSYSFQTDTSTGLRLGTTGNLAFSASGATVVSLTSSRMLMSANIEASGTRNIGNSGSPFNNTYSQKFLANDGTNALPSITFKDETNTGIYRSAANNLSFTVNGTNQLDLKENRAKFTNAMYGNTAILSYGLPARVCMFSQTETVSLDQSTINWQTIHSTSFPDNTGTLVIPANYVKKGTNINVMVCGSLTNVSTPSIACKIALNATNLATTANFTLDNVSNQYFKITACLCFRGDASASTSVATGIDLAYNGTSASKKAGGASDVSLVNTTIAQTLSVQIKYTSTGTSTIDSFHADCEIIAY